MALGYPSVFSLLSFRHSSGHSMSAPQRSPSECAELGGGVVTAGRELRSLEEVTQDILALERKADGLIADILSVEVASQVESAK